MKELESLVKAKEISEDEKFAAKEALQKKIDAFNARFDELLTLKEKEINV
jgi:ribosome recycling factor